MNDVVARRRNPILRFFAGLWTALNFSRRLVMNLLFLVLVLFVVGLMLRDDKPAPLTGKSVLLLEPRGRLMEQDDRDPLTRLFADANEDSDDSNRVVQLRDLVGAIDGAAKDARIQHILLDVDHLQVQGFASLHEVTGALQRFRASGKKITAFSEGLDQAQYLLASQADTVYIDPQGGGVMMLGLASYRPYMRTGLQDKLGVDFQLFKVGEYKSAAEPFVRDDASPESKEADLFWMNDLWQRYVADVAKARKLTPEAVRAGIDGLAEGVAGQQGDLANYALSQKWVDGLKTREEVEDWLAKQGHGDGSGDLRTVGYGAWLAQLRGAVAKFSGESTVGVVVAEGEIVPGKQDPGVIGGESTAALLRDAREDGSIKAVVLRVNSPGGEVFASEQIRREVEALKKAGKPVVVSMGDVAASGGYWISMNADRIYADPSTITGSIGIFGLIPNFTRALDKIGVHTDGVGTAPLAGAMDPTRPMPPALATLIQSVIDKGYRDFTGKVAAARGKPVADIDAVARGRVWSGAQAKERGLVDAFGGLQDAANDAAQRAKLGAPGSWRVRYIEQGSMPFGGLFGSRMEATMARAVIQHGGPLRGVFAADVPSAEKQWQAIESQLLRRDGKPVKSMAHCFCAF